MNQNNSPAERTLIGNKQITAHGHYNLSKSLTSIEKMDRHKCIVKFLEEKLRHHLSWSLDRVCVRGDSESSISDLNAVIPDIWIETISDSPVTTQQVVETSLVISVIDTDEEIQKKAIEQCLNIPSLRELVLISMNRLDVEIFSRGNNSWVSSIYDDQSTVLIETVDIHLTMSEFAENFFISKTESNQIVAPELITYKISSEINSIPGAKINNDFQIPYRPDISPMESGRGYLIRLAEELGYASPLAITKLIGAKIKGIDNEKVINKLAPTLRYSSDELKNHFYCFSGSSSQTSLKSFFGHDISVKHLNLHSPRLCPICITEKQVIKAHWDINLITVCSTHRCELIDRCPKCTQSLTWSRSKISECKCGFDLRKAKVKPASKYVLDLTKVIHQAIQPLFEQSVSKNESNFCDELLALSLPGLLKIIQYVGNRFHPNYNKFSTINFKRNNLRQGMELVETAGKVLAEWPKNYHEQLRIIKNNYQVKNAIEKSVANVYGSYYRTLFKIIENAEFSFLRVSFERYLNMEWEGVYRTSLISNSANIHHRWLTVQQASKLADGIGKKGLRKLYVDGEIKGFERQIQTTGQREVWLERNSLETWISESKKWMMGQTASKLLGININNLRALGKAGLVNFKMGRVSGGESRGWIFEIKTINSIYEAFNKHHVPEIKYQKKGNDLIALQHAFNDLLNQESGVPAVIKAVLERKLIPIGRAGKFSGIRDYIFDLNNLRKYDDIGNGCLKENYLNLSETQQLLGVHVKVLTALIINGFLNKQPARVKSGEQLILASEIFSFKEKYIFCNDLARQINSNGNWVKNYLTRLGLEAIDLKFKSRNLSSLYERDALANIKIIPSNNRQISAFNALLKSMRQNHSSLAMPEQTKMQLSKEQIGALPSFFSHIPDPRKASSKKKHELSTVLAIVVGAEICGMRGGTEIADWAKDLPLEHLRLLGCNQQSNLYLTPSSSLISDLLNRINPDKFNDALKKCKAAIILEC